MPKAEYLAGVVTEVAYNFVRLYPRAAALSDEMAADGPHIVGAFLFVAETVGDGAIAKHPKGNHYRLDPEAAVASMGEFFDALTAQAVDGKLSAARDFAVARAKQLPEAMEADFLAKKQQLPSYTILNRGELLTELLPPRAGGAKTPATR